MIKINLEGYYKKKYTELSFGEEIWNNWEITQEEMQTNETKKKRHIGDVWKNASLSFQSSPAVKCRNG